VRTPSALKILSEESNEVCLVQEHTKISSKAIYRNGCGSSTMEMILLDILPNISPTCMKDAKMRKLFVVLRYALLVIRLFATSWRGETKYTPVLLHGTEFEERNQGEKMRSDAIEVSSNFIS